MTESDYENALAKHAATISAELYQRYGNDYGGYSPPETLADFTDRVAEVLDRLMAKCCRDLVFPEPFDPAEAFTAAGVANEFDNANERAEERANERFYGG